MSPAEIFTQHAKCYSFDINHFSAPTTQYKFNNELCIESLHGDSGDFEDDIESILVDKCVNVVLQPLSSLIECKYRRPSLSQSQMDSLKYFEISVPRHIRFAELRKKK